MKSLFLALLFFSGVAHAADSIDVFLSEDAYQGDALANISIDGAAVATNLPVRVAHGKPSQRQSFPLTLTQGAHSVVVTFTNDAWGGSSTTDRNLYVDAIYVNRTQIVGSTIFTNNGSKTFGFTVEPDAIIPASYPPIGVYEGNGCSGATATKTFNTFLGRNPDRYLDFIATDTWTNMSNDEGWTAWCWQQAGVQGDKVTFTIGLAVNGVSLSQVLAGAGDATYLAMAKDLVAKGFGTAILRLGHEMNGNWYSWSAAGQEKTYAQVFQHVVGIFRSVPGAAFKFDWCPSAGWLSTVDYTDLYPGDAYVDIIGMDVYAKSAWNTSKQPASVIWANMNSNYSLDFLPSLGKTHNKPIAIDEWGVGDSSNGNGSGDMPEIMTDMLNYIKANGLVYSNYWDFDAGDYNSKISTGERPNEAAVFKAYYAQ